VQDMLDYAPAAGGGKVAGSDTPAAARFVGQAELKPARTRSPRGVAVCPDAASRGTAYPCGNASAHRGNIRPRREREKSEFRYN